MHVRIPAVERSHSSCRAAHFSVPAHLRVVPREEVDAAEQVALERVVPESGWEAGGLGGVSGDMWGGYK